MYAARDASTRRLSAAARRRCADPRPAAWRMVRPRAGARGRSQPRQPGARPDRPGDASCSARRATPTSSPSTATCSISAIACWSSSPMATSRGRSPGSCCISTWQHMLFQRLTGVQRPASSREFAAKAVKEVAYHRELASRMDGPARRRDRGERAADGRRARLVLALRPRAVRGRRGAARR